MYTCIHTYFNYTNVETHEHIYAHVYTLCAHLEWKTVKKSERETHREIEGKKRVHKRKSVRENIILWYVWINVWMFMYIYVYLHMYKRLWMFTETCICIIHIYIHLCIYTYPYIHIVAVSFSVCCGVLDVCCRACCRVGCFEWGASSRCVAVCYHVL